MRHKTVFFILLFSFIFNIFHDTLLDIESSDDCPIAIQIIEETTPNSICHDVSSFHHFFHFHLHLLNILNRFNIQLLSREKSLLNSHLSIYTPYLTESIFRPPII
jgi:hypothetical protein